MTCSFEDATAAVPYATTTSSHRKIAAYYSVGWGVGHGGMGVFSTARNKIWGVTTPPYKYL